MQISGRQGLGYTGFLTWNGLEGISGGDGTAPYLDFGGGYMTNVCISQTVIEPHIKKSELCCK